MAVSGPNLRLCSSNMIEICSPNSDWPKQFAAAAAALRAILGDDALAIEHIGSTAVPGLGAKDVIDIQVSVRALDPAILETLNNQGYPARTDYRDVFAGIPAESPELSKYFAREPAGERRLHIHIRECGPILKPAGNTKS